MTSPATVRLMGLLVIVGMVAGCGDAPSSDAPVDRHAEAQAKYGALSGIVRTSDGALIGGVEVTAFPAGATIDDQTEPANMSVSNGEESDAKVMGRDWGMVLEPGVYDVYARRGDVAMNRLRVAESVRIKLGNQTVVNFSLPPLPE